MELGISSYSFPWAAGVPGYDPSPKLTAHELLRLAIGYEVKHVQYGDNLPLAELGAAELRELKSLAQRTGVQIQPGTRRLTVENIEKYISIANNFASPFVRVVIDDTHYEPSAAEVKQVIHQLLPLLRQHQVILAIENHDRFTAASLRNIIEETDTELVGICLDTANSLGAGEGFNEVLATLAPYTVNLHVKDIRIQRLSHKMGFTVEGVAAGDGMLDIPAIVQILQPFGRCKVATLEVWSNPAETIEQTLITEKQLVNKSIQYLKQIVA